MPKLRKLHLFEIVLGLVAFALLIAFLPALLQGGKDLYRVRHETREALAKYPATEVNATAARLEPLSRSLGLALSRQIPQEPGFEPLSGDLVRAFAGYSDQLWPLTGEPLPKPGAELAAFYEAFQPVLDEIVELLLSSPVPVWEQDFRAGALGPRPDLMGAYTLQKALILHAAEVARAGDEERALEVLEASWRMNEFFLQHPEVIPSLQAPKVLRLQQPVLRSLCSVPEPWLSRLRETDLQARALRLLRADGIQTWLENPRLIAQQSQGRDESQPKDSLGPKAVFVATIQMWDAARWYLRLADHMAKKDPVTFNSSEFVDEETAKLSPVRIAARSSSPPVDFWTQAARLEAVMELTARIAEARRTGVAGLEALAQKRTGEPSDFPPLTWIYEPGPEGLTIRLSGDFEDRLSPDIEIPLTYTMMPARCSAS